MSTYFIGDIHGCYGELKKLLEKIHFSPQEDQLIFVGDLINRGPQSLDVLRFIKELGSCAQIVLGNHDLSFIAYHYGAYHGKNSHFPDISKAYDCEALITWLRQQPLLIHNTTLDVIVVHAGIPPRWSLKQAKKQAKKAERKLQSSNIEQYLKYAYENHSDQWQNTFTKYDKFRYRLNGFTRLRYCHQNGEPDFHDKCPIGEQKKGLEPWFKIRKSMQYDGDTRVIFGHWAALGFYNAGHAICTDSGCAWGGELTAIELVNQTVSSTQVISHQQEK